MVRYVYKRHNMLRHAKVLMQVLLHKILGGNKYFVQIIWIMQCQSTPTKDTTGQKEKRTRFFFVDTYGD